MSTKQRILAAAVELFNENGTAAVSTNHIAEACRISPGNLYYHYKNKAQIIYSILDEMFLRWNGIWQLAPTGVVTEETLRDKLNGNFQLLWEYRFFYREAVVLLHGDEQLKARHIAMTRERFYDQAVFAERFVKDGVLVQLDDRDKLSQVITICWLIASNWLSFLEMNGEQISEMYFEKGVDLIWVVLSPYMKDVKSNGEQEHL